MRFGDVRCTSIVRTGFDLLRDPDLDDDRAVEVTTALFDARRALLGELADRLEGAFRMPYRSAALARLGRVELRLRPVDVRQMPGDAPTGQPSLTR